MNTKTAIETDFKLDRGFKISPLARGVLHDLVLYIIIPSHSVLLGLLLYKLCWEFSINLIKYQMSTITHQKAQLHPNTPKLAPQITLLPPFVKGSQRCGFIYSCANGRKDHINETNLISHKRLLGCVMGFSGLKSLLLLSRCYLGFMYT